MEYVEFALQFGCGGFSIYHFWRAVNNESAYHAAMASAFAVVALA